MSDTNLSEVKRFEKAIGYGEYKRGIKECMKQGVLSVLKELKVAKQCIDYQNITCKNKDCLNKVCPLNKNFKELEEGEVKK